MVARDVVNGGGNAQPSVHTSSGALDSGASVAGLLCSLSPRRKSRVWHSRKSLARSSGVPEDLERERAMVVRDCLKNATGSNGLSS